MYSENPADFPIGSVSFINLVLANATSHTRTRWQTFEMRNITTFLILFFFVFQSCGNKEKQRTIEIQEQKEKSRLDSIALVNKLKKDSLVTLQEKIAIGNINFGIDRKEYKKEEAKFLKTTNSKLGSFKFRLKPDFHNDNRGLWHLYLFGETRNHSYFNDFMLSDFKQLKTILTKKYGKPNEEYIYNNLPNLKWIIGNKKINLTISENNYEYTMILKFRYQTEQEKNKIEQEINKRKKEAIEKAVENL